MIRRAKESIYVHDDKFISNPGTRVVDDFVLDFPEQGGVALKKCGEKPIYDMIQANLVNCDLQNVIESCVHSNQMYTTTHDGLDTLIADFTGVTTLGDLYVATKRMENTWKDLPLEVREEFGSDLKSFIRGIGTTDFDTKVNNGFDRFNKSIQKVNVKDSTPVLSPTPVPDSTTVPEPTPVPDLKVEV